jgi:hypothetical protein
MNSKMNPICSKDRLRQLTMYESQYSKTRLGKDNDGGYVICSLPGDYDCLISGGIADDISFEQEFIDNYGPVNSYAFDGTIERLPSQEPRLMFVKKNLGNKDGESSTRLSKYLEPYSNVFMKIDIEGHEFRLLPTLIGKYMKKVKQLVIEIHSPGYFQLHPVYFAEFSDVTHEFMFDLLAAINTTHTLVHVHPNNVCQAHTYSGVLLPNVFECTYIRNDFVSSKVKNRLPLPTKHDMPNDPLQADIVLSGFPFSS